MPPKPTVVLVPGAWHRPSQYEPLLSSLRDAGFPTASHKLPSVDAEAPAEATLANDAAFIRNSLLLPELDGAGNDVILLLHSYAGIPGGAAAKGLGKADRPGRPAVLGLVYMCAMVRATGRPLHSDRSQLTPWAKFNDDSGLTTSIRDPITVMYHDAPDKEWVEEAIKTIGSHAWAAFSTPSPEQAYPDAAFDGRRVYIRCHQDRALSLQVQDMFLGRVEGLEWQVEDLKDSGHSPFLSHTSDIVDLLLKQNEVWS